MFEAQQVGGYLATITNASEDAFVASLIAGVNPNNVGWFGATDDGHFGDWQVFGGPEDGTSFWSGAGSASGGHAVNGQYAHWRDAGEPSGDGSYAYVGGTGWNDYGGSDVGFVIEICGRPQDSFATNEDRVSVITASQLLANDFDPDGDTFAITGVSATSAHGATVTLSNGTIFYDPTQATELQGLNAGFGTADTFTYTIVDVHGDTSTATVTLDVQGRDEAGLVTTSGGTWGVPFAWSPQVVPGSGNDVLVSGGEISSLIDSVAAHSLTISSGAVVLTGGAGIAIGGDLTLDSSSISAEASDITVSHSDETRSLSLLNGSTLATNSGGIVTIGGSFSGFEVSGNSFIQADGHISIDAALLCPFTGAFTVGSSDSDDHSSITANGSITINGVVTNDGFYVGEGAFLTSQDDFVSIGMDIGDDFINRGFIEAPGQLVTTGGVVMTGDIFINSEIAGTFTNFGEITATRNITIGREIGHGFTNTGHIAAGNNLTIDGAIAGNFTNDGLLHAGNVLTITGSIEGFFNGDTGVIEAAALNIGNVGATLVNTGSISVSSGGEIGTGFHNFGGGSFQLSGGGFDFLGDVENGLNGTIQVSEGVIFFAGTVQGNVQGDGHFNIQHGTMEFGGTVNSGVAVSFSSATTDTLIIDQLDTFAGELHGFGGTTVSNSDVIDLAGVDYANLVSADFGGSNLGGTLNLNDGDSHNLNFAGAYRPGNFVLDTDGLSGTRITFESQVL